MEMNLEIDCGGGGNTSKTGEGFIDRSAVRILLCDNDAESSEEVVTLLLRCSYQVISVKSARQVIDALNAEGPEIDIVLSEIDIPMAKGMKMLKYITRNNDLRRIPVIMMSALDEVSIVVKCLRLGAADYLVKPLRTNELLNLWTHMWRRRRMLGLAEKNMVNYEFDLAASDPSDANTNSTTLFSDDTDDKSCRGANPELATTLHWENESAIVAEDLPVTDSLDYRPVVPGISERRTGQLSSGPKKSKLKIGESSAFFTYVKSNMPQSNSRAASHVEEDPNRHSRIMEVNHMASGEHLKDVQMVENGDVGESYSQGDDFPSSTSLPDSQFIERSCTPPGKIEFLQSNINDDKYSNGSQLDSSGLAAQSAYPFYVPNQMMMPSPAHLYQKNLHGLQNHAATTMVSQYSHPHQCPPPHVPGMASFAYYPLNMCLQPGQIPGGSNSWQSLGTSSSSAELNLSKVDRREAALIKFRQKRKERCFDKKIRYVNRKKLAERRPRVRGQFVRKLNGVDVDLNGQPASIAEEEDEEEDEQVSRDSSPEYEASEY